MKHPDPVLAVLEWLGREAQHPQVLTLLRRFDDWLRSEGLEAGVVGPGERDRTWNRHIADSLSFAVPWREADPPSILDLGSGVGLPGIPLAILFPKSEVVLVDRSKERLRLGRRAAHILDLENITTRVAELEHLTEPAEAAVMRAVLKPNPAIALFGRILRGTGVLGLTRSVNPPVEVEGYLASTAATGLVGEVIECNRFDPPGWLLSMSKP